MQDKEQLHIKFENLDPKNPTLTILHGEALKLQEPTAVKVAGTLEAPRRFYENRKELINPQTAHVVIDINQKSIKLVTDENNYYGSIIEGQLKLANELTAFKINEEKFYSLQELLSLMKKNRFYFLDKEAHAGLIVKLMSFRAKIQTEIEKVKDNRGNLTDMLKVTTQSEVPLCFKLNIPIFEGFKNYTFEVEIGYDVRDADIKFYLESPELIELSTSEKTALLNAEAESFEGLAVMFK